MACYPCTHCNKCGMYYSVPTATVCADCETVFPVGTSSCPRCGGRKLKAVPAASLGKTKRSDKQNPAASTL